MGQYSSKPITQFVTGSEVLATDIYAAVDTTDDAQSPVGTTKKYSMVQLQEFLADTFMGNEIETVYVATVSNLDAVYVNGPNAGVGATLTNDGALAALVINGVNAEIGMRVLVAFQSDAKQNGIYTVTTVGDAGTRWVMTRASDYDNTALGEINQGDYVGVLFGTVDPLTFRFITSETPLVIGTDDIVFQKQTTPTGNAWVNVGSATVTMAVNTGYTCAAGATQITLTLPPVSAVGDFVEVTGKDAGLFIIAQDAGQQIHIGSASTTLGATGYVESLEQYTNIRLICIEANTVWTGYIQGSADLL